MLVLSLLRVHHLHSAHVEGVALGWVQHSLTFYRNSINQVKPFKIALFPAVLAVSMWWFTPTRSCVLYSQHFLVLIQHIFYLLLLDHCEAAPALVLLLNLRIIATAVGREGQQLAKVKFLANLVLFLIDGWLYSKLVTGDLWGDYIYKATVFLLLL